MRQAAAVLAAAIAALASGSCAHKPTTSATGATPARAPSSNAGETPTTVGSETAPGIAWHTPAPGAYRYHYERTGDDPASYDGSLTIAAAKAPGTYAEARDHQSARIVRHYTSSASGVQETAFTLATSSGDSRCAWSKPITFIPADPKPDQQWTAKAMCTLKVGSGTTRLAFEGTATVKGNVSAKVGNTSVPVLRIDRRITLRSTSADGKTDTRLSTAVDYFDMARGLLAQSTVDVKDSTTTGTIAYRIVETMLTVQPEVSR
jgi:hypothetical protein